MTLRILSDAELERRLHTDPDNLQLILEAARRFPRTAERAGEADEAEQGMEEADDRIEELKAEIQTLKDDLKQAESDRDELQKEADDIFEQLATVNGQVEDLTIEVARLNTVLELVADA